MPPATRPLAEIRDDVERAELRVYRLLVALERIGRDLHAGITSAPRTHRVEDTYPIW